MIPHRLVWCWLGGAVLTLPLLAASAAAPPAGGFFDLYQYNRQTGAPNYITEDFLLLAYSLIRQQTLAETETQRIIPLFARLLAGLAAAAPGQEEAGQANRDFIAVLNALLAGGDARPETPRAQAELALILAAQGIAPSPLWEQSLDYSQFTPRGRYAAAPELASYFRAMRYAGAVLFAVQDSQATGVTPALADRLTAQALSLAQALQDNPELAAVYQELDDLLTWQFGPGEDLTVRELITVAPPQSDVPRPAQRAALLAYAREHGRQPRIFAGLVDAGKLEPGLRPADVLTGWRLLPSRYTPDSAAFQQLVYDRVGAYRKDCSGQTRPFGLTLIAGKAVKGFPSAWELLALLGSAEAAAAVKKNRQHCFQGYEAAAQDAARLLGDAQGLAGAQGLLMRTWLGGAPPDPDQRRLTSMLGFWTWQRYLGVLYSKQSTTLTGKSMPAPDHRPGAWLEPASTLYLALAQVVAGHRRMTPHPAWDRFAAVLDRCLAISFRESQRGAPSADDEVYLNGLDQTLLALAGGPDHPIVVDVHTNPASGEVLEEGLGFTRIVEKGKARGALFHHYEFRQPLNQRLDDAAWTARLQAGDAPASPFQRPNQ